MNGLKAGIKNLYRFTEFHGCNVIHWEKMADFGMPACFQQKTMEEYNKKKLKMA